MQGLGEPSGKSCFNNRLSFFLHRRVEMDKNNQALFPQVNTILSFHYYQFLEAINVHNNRHLKCTLSCTEE